MSTKLRNLNKTEDWGKRQEVINNTQLTTQNKKTPRWGASRVLGESDSHTLVSRTVTVIVVGVVETVFGAKEEARDDKQNAQNRQN